MISKATLIFSSFILIVSLASAEQMMVVGEIFTESW